MGRYIMRDKKPLNWKKSWREVLIGSAITVIFLLCVIIPPLTMPASWIGDNALTDVKRGVLIQLICNLGIVIPGVIAVLIVFKKNMITEGLSILKEKGFNRGFFRGFIKALPMVLATVLFIIVVLNLFTGFYLKFSTSLGNAEPIHKTVLLYNIERDIKYGETVVKTYDEVSTNTLSVSTGGRGGKQKIKTYVLVCDNEDRFMLSSSDASAFERENLRHEGGRVEIEYYKNSHIIKGYRYIK
jgi:hypothetical protein